jgi:hypothetical protein
MFRAFGVLIRLFLNVASSCSVKILGLTTFKELLRVDGVVFKVCPRRESTSSVNILG